MNMQNIMAQAQKMKMEITKKQEEIYNTTYTGESEWVEIVINGKKEVLSTKIKYEGDLNEDKDMLGDMIALALKDAIKKVENDMNKKLGMYSDMLGGLM